MTPAGGTLTTPAMTPMPARGGAETRAYTRAVRAIIAVSLLLHVAALVLGRTALAGWTSVHYPTHAAIETCGAVMAFFVAFILVLLERNQRGTSYNTWIAAALSGMGVLDGIHALQHAGHGFVWLHSLATLVGGAFFAATWLPRAGKVPLGLAAARVAIGVVAGVGVASAARPDLVPVMVVDGHFTPVAQAMNLVGGALLWAAGLRLVLTWRRTRNPDDLLFFIHCALFGAAALMFAWSRLWDVAWWGWHLLRLGAYGVAVVFALRSLLEGKELELRRANEALEAQGARLAVSNSSLQSANRELEAFVHSVTHDLRAPLRSIEGLASVLGERHADALGERGQAYLQRIRAAAVRMDSLIDHLLALSRLAMQEMTIEPVDLSALAREVVADLENQEPARRATFVIQDGVRAVGDPALLRAVLENLLGNAYKFTARHPTARIEFGAEDGAGPTVYFVRDDGAGFDPSLARRLFGPFQRLHATAEFPGTGVGLASVQRVVRRHGGDVWAEGGVEKGATFYFTLGGEE